MPDTHQDRKPSVDPEMIASLRELQEEGQPDFLGDLIAAYLGEAPARLSAIENGIASADMIKVMRACHLMKGSSLNLGATRFAGMLKDLEIKAATDQFTVMAGAWAKALEEFAMVERELKNLVGTPPA